MADLVLRCPHCQGDVPLTEALAAPMLQSLKSGFQAQLAERDQRLQAELARFGQLETDMAARETKLRASVQQSIEQQRAGIAQAELERARAQVAAELLTNQQALQESQALLQAREAKLVQAQQAEAGFLRAQRELADEKREMELTVERRIQESLLQVRQSAKSEAESALRLKLMEKDQLLAATQTKLAELTQKVEQGSQQIQGEVMELALESLLRSRFVSDHIQPVAKGDSGADLEQTVRGTHGVLCGKILWESKRTKQFSSAWIEKLRNDQRNANADIAVLVSQTLPKDVEDFALIDGIWVIAPALVVPVAMLLRDGLMRTAQARSAGIGLRTKTEQVYDYLTGARFRARLSAMVEAYQGMKSDLDRERIAIKRLWAKREIQIERISSAAVGLWGELQGIAGQSMADIEGLELQALATLGVEDPQGSDGD